MARACATQYCAIAPGIELAFRCLRSICLKFARKSPPDKFFAAYRRGGGLLVGLSVCKYSLVRSVCKYPCVHHLWREPLSHVTEFVRPTSEIVAFKRFTIRSTLVDVGSRRVELVGMRFGGWLREKPITFGMKAAVSSLQIAAYSPAHSKSRTAHLDPKLASYLRWPVNGAAN